MSPTRKKFDFLLDNKGYIMARVDKGRSWQRTGNPDTPSRRSVTDAKYGELDDVLDHPEVWDDWSGGFGQAYRRQGENTYHWGENFDARFPRQLVHCQVPQQLAASMEIWENNILEYHRAERFLDVPLPYVLNAPVGAGGVLIVANTNASNASGAIYSPTGSTNADAFRRHQNVAVGDTLGGKIAVFGSFFYIGSTAGSGFHMQKLSDGLSYSQPAIPGQGFVTAGNILWRVFGTDAKRPTSLRSLANSAASAAVLEANWSATITVGNGFYPIQDMITLGDQLLLGLPDGLYAGDSGGTFVNVLSNIQNQINEDNCRDLTVHNNSVIAPHISGIYEYRPGAFEAEVRAVGPTGGLRSPISGRVRAVKSFGRWLYAGLYTGSQSYLLAGDINRDKPIWHTLTKFPHVSKIHRIHVDGVTAASSAVKVPNRMWVATDASIDTSGTSPVYWWPIAMNDDNPVNATLPFKPNYASTARIDLGSVDWGAPSTPKVFRSVEVWADNLSEATNTRWALVYYDVDQSGSFTLLGTCNISPKSILYFPSTEGSYVTGQSIELSLRSFATDLLVGGYRTLAPVYRAIVLRGALRPNSVDEITAVVRVADGMRDRQGQEMRSAATMISELRALATRSTPVTLIDLTGAQSIVSVLPPIEESESYQKGDDEPEVHAKIRMAVMTFS